MAGLMAAPMVLIELVVMRAMYRNTQVNLAIAAASTLAFVGCFAATRWQTSISDSEFLRSMIPHHAGGDRSATPGCERQGNMRGAAGQASDFLNAAGVMAWSGNANTSR